MFENILLATAIDSLVNIGAAVADSPAADGGLWGLFLKGGFFMWPILIGSIVMLAMALERQVNLRSGAVRPRKLAREVERRIANGDTTGAMQECAVLKTSAYARMVHACLQREGAEAYAMETAIEEAGARELINLRRGTRTLGVIADIAPLLGLLGTVTGMIKAFNVVAAAGALGKAELLAEGIGEALMTTAFGLCVAVPAIILYHYFRGRADNWVRIIEDDCLSYAQLLRDNKGSPRT